MTAAVRSTIDCQNCGGILRVLTDEETARVAAYPYDFIWFCRTCQRDEMMRDEV